jgi:hypothetical protein
LVKGHENNIPAAAKQWKPKAKLEASQKAMIARAVTDVRERTGMALFFVFWPSVQCAPLSGSVRAAVINA